MAAKEAGEASRLHGTVMTFKKVLSVVAWCSCALLALLLLVELRAQELHYKPRKVVEANC
jgi:hypothetical protein